MKNFLQVLVVVLFAAFNFGCATAVKTTEAADLGQVKAQTTGFLLAYTFSVEDFAAGDYGCTLELKRGEDKSHIHVDIKYGKNEVLVETKPGTYYFHDLNCGKHDWDLNTNRVARFKVIENKVSLTAPVVFKISDKLRITFTDVNRKTMKERSLNTWGALSDQTKSNLISGYTSVPITSELIEASHSWGETEVSTDGVKFKKVDRKEFSLFKSCYSAEDDVNGLWLGHIAATVSFDNPVNIDMGTQPNSFTNQFVDCVKSEVSRFDNSEKKYKKVRLNL